MQLSDRLNRLSPSATLAMSQKSNELKAQGIDVINLSVGEPDFNTPDHIKEAAKKAIDENYSRYSPVPGYPALRNAIVAKLKKMGISVKFDDADNKKPGWKFAEYELKGVPVRLAMGGRDLENNTIEVMRRDTLEKETITCDGIEEYVQNLLEEIQQNIFQKALDHRTACTVTVDTYEEFKEKIEEGLFIMAHWDGTPETEEQIKNETKATIRCIPLEGDKTPGKCMVTGKPSTQRVLFARAY